MVTPTPTVSTTAGRLLVPISPVIAVVSGLGGDVAGWKIAVGIAASVLAVLPLGLLFLPAFVLVAVVPLVIGLFGSAH